MPDIVNMPQPPHSLLMRTSKESPGRQIGMNSAGFPEYLKHTEMMGDVGNRIKFTSSNSLFQAVLKGRVRGTEYLLDRGTAVNGRNDYGYSVLTAALHIDDNKRRDKMFQLLLQRGADPHFKDTSYDRTVLHWACLLGRTEQVQSLLGELAADIDLKEQDRGSFTALHHAVMAGHLPVVRLLVDIHRKFGVTVDVADKLGLTPYLHAKRLGYRDVADYLHSEGMASQGHGDMLFRTPREWSQIGKFERRKAIEIHTQEAINTARIQGKIRDLRNLGDGLMASPRMAIPNIVLPSYSPTRNPGVRLAVRHAGRLSMSLPSLQEHNGVQNGLPRPFSANGATAADADAAGLGDTGSNKGSSGHGGALKPPKEAFVNDAVPVAAKDLGLPACLPPLGNSGPTGVWEGAGVDLSLSTGQGPNSTAAFTLMELNEKGRHVGTYRQSQFDETKASEYQHMLGNLNSIMDMLSQQQSKSFRKSVKYQRPETPKVAKSKTKVSSLAVILGRDRGGRRNKRRSAKPSGKKEHAGTKKKKEKGGGDEKKTKASEKKKVVPLLKVNDKIV